MFVNVPWTDTTYSAGNGIGLSSTTFSVAGGDGLTGEATGLKITPDQTTVTSIYNSSLKIGTATNQEYIDFTTSNEVNTFVSNTEILSVTSSGVNITGNLSVSGTTSIILPTSDPSNDGQLWNDGGTIRVSAGAPAPAPSKF